MSERGRSGELRAYCWDEAALCGWTRHRRLNAAAVAAVLPSAGCTMLGPRPWAMPSKQLPARLLLRRFGPM